MGAKAKTDPSFAAQYQDLPATDPIKVTKDGGTINAISGATLTSRAVCNAATEANDTYNKLKDQIVEQLNNFKK
jgi:electron transport complex protein RnfG